MNPSSFGNVLLLGHSAAVARSAPFANRFACSGESPQKKRLPLPARQAYSHSASVGSL